MAIDNKRFLEIGENESLDLNDPKEKFMALIWICKNGDKPYISTYLLNSITAKGLYSYIDSSEYERLDLFSAVQNFFRLFISSENQDFLSEYLLDYSRESEIVKKSRLNQLLGGIIFFADHMWESGASSVKLAFEKNDFSWLKENNLEELSCYYYTVWKNLNGIYDSIWNNYSVFIDKDQFTFSYFYSHKENPENRRNSLEKKELLTEENYQSSRDNILKRLLNEEENLFIYNEYEKKLITQGYLNIDKNQWLKNAASLIRFYNYCEAKEMFKHHHSGSQKGVLHLRRLYNFHEGKDINHPNKRKKQNTKTTKNEFLFLSLV